MPLHYDQSFFCPSSKKPQDTAIQALFHAGLLTHENQRHLYNNKKYSLLLGGALRLLQGGELANQSNWIALVNNVSGIERIYRCLHALKNAGLLNQNNWDSVIKENQCSFGRGVLHMPFTLKVLSCAGIASQENWNIFIENIRHSEKIKNWLSLLRQASLITQKNFDTLIRAANDKENDFSFMDKCLEHLLLTELLSQTNFDTLINCRNQMALNICIGTLLEAGLLNQENWEALVGVEQYSYRLSDCLAILNRAELGTQENWIVLVSNVHHIESVYYSLYKLQQHNFLDHDSWNILANNTAHADSLANCLYALKKVEVATPDRIESMLSILDHIPKISRFWSHLLEKFPNEFCAHHITQFFDCLYCIGDTLNALEQLGAELTLEQYENTIQSRSSPLTKSSVCM